MKLIQPSVEILSNSDPYKMIEIAGRTCYKSEDKITEDSCKEFVQRMISNGHTAMLEHGTIYLTIPFDDWIRNLYTWSAMFPEGCPWIKRNSDSSNIYITTNERHIIENNIMPETVTYMCKPTEYHYKRVSVRFICDRGVSHELVRHKKLCVT